MSWTKSLSRLLLPLCVLALTPTAPTLAHSAVDATAMTEVKGGDFTLQGPGGPLSLGDLRGKVVLMFFGYTSCVDVCPLALAKINASFATLDKKELERVQALFITLDPKRDTRERLDEYIGYFQPNIVGLRDDETGIRSAARQYGISYSRKVVPESAIGYAISHPLVILLLDHEGRYVKALPHNADTNQIVSDVRGLLNAAN